MTTSMLAATSALSVGVVPMHHVAQSRLDVVECRKADADRYRALDPVHTETLVKAAHDALIRVDVAHRRHHTSVDMQCVRHSCKHITRALDIASEANTNAEHLPDTALYHRATVMLFETLTCSLHASAHNVKRV